MARLGRPPIPEVDRRNRNLTFRSRGKLHEQLQAAAKAADRSISEEIERRLEQSFWYDDAVGSSEMAQLAREVIICASSIKRYSKGGPENDKRARDVLLAAVEELFRPTHQSSLKLSSQEMEAFSKKGVSALDAQLDGKVLAQIIQGRTPEFKIETVDPQTDQAAIQMEISRDRPRTTPRRAILGAKIRRGQ